MPNVVSSIPVRWAIATLGFLAACGGTAESWTEGRPRIDALRFIQQAPGDPMGLSFLVRFTDTDGDVGSGTIKLILEDQESSSLAAKDVFDRQTPPLSLTSTTGELEVTVRLSKTPDVGQRLKIGMVLVDARGRESNDPNVVLEAVEGQ